ncbi:Heavy-metal-associated domain [Popillia japonica]|uniref:Heavy-metal-associated domain n=1 Tax=Popillia japonica TaxID=7064 RepID=A0AAW1MFM8_POPJA
MEVNAVKFVRKDGETTTEKDYEEFKAQLQKIDGTLVSVAEDLSYLDVTALEGNYDIIKDITDTLGYEPVINQKSNEIEPVPSDSLQPAGDRNVSERLLHLDGPPDSTIKVNIVGMTCQSCVRNIEETIGKKPGIINVKVNLAEKSGLVHYENSTVTPQEICDAIEDMGFEASLPLLTNSHKKYATP